MSICVYGSQLTRSTKQHQNAIRDVDIDGGPVRQVGAERQRRDRREVEAKRADEIAARVRARLLELMDQGAEIDQLGNPDEVASNMVDRLPIANPWPGIVGPCYTSGALQRELNVSRAALSKAVGDGRLLRLRTSTGQYVYPAFQVVDGALVPGLREVLNTLRRGASVDPWTWAQWLNAPVPDPSVSVCENEEPPMHRHIERLITGDLEGIVREAELAAASWES